MSSLTTKPSGKFILASISVYDHDDHETYSHETCSHETCSHETIAMKQGLQLKLSQQLTLTPQLQQAIRLLQMSTLELDQEVSAILEANPLLEREEPIDEAPIATPPPDNVTTVTKEPAEASDRELMAGDELTWLDANHGAGQDDDENFEPQTAQHSTTLREHLLWQLNLSQTSLRDRQLVTLLIEALDENGYLTQTLEDISAMLPEDLAIDADDLQIALKYLQQLDPTGVGARTPAECLLLQLAALPQQGAATELARKILAQELPALANRDYSGIKRRLRCDDDLLRTAHTLIMQLNPHPGEHFASNETRYIIPDVIVEKVKNNWVTRLNQDAMPRLRVNQMYADILGRNRDGGQIAGQLQEARWLIKNISQRFDTILRVSQCIVARQRNFLEHGEVAMRPLVLREIADEVELHESTVSRVTTQKFMMTPRGIFELKYFFGSHVNTEAGGACSATAIRALIKQMISAENTKKPLSDGQIAELLGQQGIMVARRTIAKYREALQIPPANQRKAL